MFWSLGLRQARDREFQQFRLKTKQNNILGDSLRGVRRRQNVVISTLRDEYVCDGDRSQFDARPRSLRQSVQSWQSSKCSKHAGKRFKTSGESFKHHWFCGTMWTKWFQHISTCVYAYFLSKSNENLQK